MGLAKRPLYKPERPPARVKAWRPGRGMQITDADISTDEMKLAVWSVALSAGVVVGRLLGYDQARDVFRVIGKSMHTGKAGEFDIHGEEVGATVQAARIMNGGGFKKRAG